MEVKFSGKRFENLPLPFEVVFCLWVFMQPKSLRSRNERVVLAPESSYLRKLFMGDLAIFGCKGVPNFASVVREEGQL